MQRRSQILRLLLLLFLLRSPNGAIVNEKEKQFALVCIYRVLCSYDRVKIVVNQTNQMKPKINTKTSSNPSFATYFPTLDCYSFNMHTNEQLCSLSKIIANVLYDIGIFTFIKSVTTKAEVQKNSTIFSDNWFEFYDCCDPLSRFFFTVVFALYQLLKLAT